ncbi:MAG TPA: NAD(P)-dependent oxidoreductase [Gemmatimonadaceae bacterium]|nr:NAD(P)-dependent oxidoreductase [Gemmatimonadaceae bacterium]
MKPNKIGVTGATGQVGAAVVKHLHEQGIPVVAVARNALGAALIDASVPDCEIRIGGTSRIDGKHVLDDCETILNCAIASSGGNPRQAYARNRALVNGLLEAKSLRWLVHFSTVAIFGELIKKHRDEQRAFDHPRPDSEYGRSKLHVERYAARRSNERGVKCTVLRLGHVYGAGIGRSREIIELSRDPGFRLPFDGRNPSNAIHVDRLALSIIALLDAAPGRDTYSFAEKANTWRDIFDWHARAIGIAPVPAMSDADSEKVHALWARASVTRDIGNWVRGLPIKRLVRSPALFDLALRILSKTPEGVTKRVTDMNRRIGARGTVASSLGSYNKLIPALYVSAGMPGPFLDLAPIPATGSGSESERSAELRAWYLGWSSPRLGPPSRPRVSEGAAAVDGR